MQKPKSRAVGAAALLLLAFAGTALAADVKPTVCVETAAPVAALDGQLAGAPAARFTVGVEDGRQFGRCVLASLDTTGAGGKRRYQYCLRCEGITGP
jgi:hypothetical protein